MGLEITITNGIKKGKNEMIRIFVENMSDEMLIENFLTDDIRTKVQDCIWNICEDEIHMLMDDAKGIYWEIGGRGERVSIKDATEASWWIEKNAEYFSGDPEEHKRLCRTMRETDHNYMYVEDMENIKRMDARMDEIKEYLEDVIFQHLHDLYYEMYEDEAIEDCFLNNFDTFVDTIAIDRWESGEEEMVYAF